MGAPVKKYYMKLDSDFFKFPKTKLLQSQDNGIIFTDIYLKLCLDIAIKNNGRLENDNGQPYSIKELAVIIDHKESIVKQAIDIMLKYNIVHFDSKTIVVTDIEIETKSESAERVKKHRQNKANPAKVIDGLGVNGNVVMTETEYNKIKQRWCNTYDEKIDRLSSYLQGNPKKNYKSHYLTLLTWFKNDSIEKKSIKARALDKDDDPLKYEK